MSTRIEPPAGHVVHSEQPVNSEPHPSQLIQSSSARGDTPADTLFLRNHSADIPLLDAETHAIALIDNVAAASDAPTRWIELDEKAVSVKELRDKYTSHDVSAVLECAGNRREEMSDRKQTEGVQWAQGTVGNGTSLCPGLHATLTGFYSELARRVALGRPAHLGHPTSGRPRDRASACLVRVRSAMPGRRLLWRVHSAQDSSVSLTPERHRLPQR